MKKMLAAVLIFAALGALASSAEVEVTRAINGTVINGATGAPLEFANVLVSRLDQPQADRRVITDARGGIAIDDLPEGRYRIAVSCVGFASVAEGLAISGGSSEVELRVMLNAREGSRIVLVSGEGARIFRDSASRDLCTVEGQVRRKDDGSGLEAANVVLTRDQDGQIWGASSMIEGRFTLAGVPAGTYTLKVLYLGMAPVEQAVTLEAGQKLKVDFDLEVTEVKEFDAIAVEGAGVMVNTADEGAAAKLGSESLADAAVRKVEEAMGRLRVQRMVAQSAPAAPLGPGASVALERLAGDADELWILERSSTKRPVNPDDPGTGCLIAIVEDKEVPVPLEHTDVRARIDGYIASVDVRQRFHNPFDETIEAEYVFPLPHDAAVNDFVMIIGERRIRGIIREKEEAREIYEQARRMGHAASLLEQERPNIFKQRVANIEPGHAIEIELHYFNALPYRDGEFEFAFPLVVGPRFNPPGSQDPIEALPRGVQPAGTGVNYLAPGERSGHDVDITVELDAGLRIQDLESLNHATNVVKDGRERALVRLNPNDTIPNKDFVLRYRVAGDEVDSEILVHREGEDGFFTMMLVPPASLENLERAPVEFVFVLDCSGSMNGWPMEKSKAAMRRALRSLKSGDSFQIIRFSEHASALGPAPVEATFANIDRGLDYIDGLHGGGGTMMIEGIKAALDFPHQPGRERIVSFMTDGYIGNEAEIFGAIAERLGETRIFSFGIGSSVNRHLIEGMARMGRGAVAYIGLDDDLDAVDQFYQAVRHPALTDVTIDWGEMQVAQVFPQRAHDLFVGRPVLMHGRYSGSGDATVRVRGTAGGQAVEMEIQVDLDGGEARKALPLIWARSELQHISDQLAQAADESLEHRGLDLALDYNLVSNWTSFVAVDASQVVDEPGTRTETVPVPVPEGVNYDTTVGGKDR